MNPSRVLKPALLGVVLAVAGALSYRHQEMVGLAGFGAGAVLGLSLCLMSRFFTNAAHAAKGYTLQTAMMGGLIATFGTMLGALIIVRFTFPEVLECFALTALAVYLVYRFAAAVDAGRNLGSVTGGVSSASVPPRNLNEHNR